MRVGRGFFRLRWRRALAKSYITRPACRCSPRSAATRPCHVPAISILILQEPTRRTPQPARSPCKPSRKRREPAGFRPKTEKKSLYTFFQEPLSCQCAVREACILRILSGDQGACAHGDAGRAGRSWSTRCWTSRGRRGGGGEAGSRGAGARRSGARAPAGDGW